MKRIHIMSLEELLEKKENDDVFTLIEVLSPESYAEGHIPGAINIPSSQLSLQAAEMDKSTELVVYCSSYTCQSSTKAARVLADMGFPRVHDFKAGKKGWVQAGFELET